MTRQTSIPCVLMRGGTSKGPYFKLSDLPADPAVRDKVLLSVMGSPHSTQIDGIGGAQSVTSKVAMVGRSAREGVDVDYLFAQVSIDKEVVDIAPSCGNILAGVGPFAIDAGLVGASDGETLVRIYNVNTNSRIDAVVKTPGGHVDYDGDTAIDGVNGTAAAVTLRFMGVAGSKTGKLLPTGNVIDEIDGVATSLIDVAVPMMLVRATDVGKTGYETKEELDADTDWLARMEQMRRTAGEMMGLGDVSEKVVPKMGLLAAPRHGGSITSRYFVPQNCHPSHAVTGGQCVATCALLTGSVADGLAQVARKGEETISIEHPMGTIDVDVSVSGFDANMDFNYASAVRTARKLFQGEVMVPSFVWSGAN